MVNNLVNSAMQEWGLETLMIVIDAMRNMPETSRMKGEKNAAKTTT
jgi:hypothetical protein